MMQKYGMIAFFVLLMTSTAFAVIHFPISNHEKRKDVFPMPHVSESVVKDQEPLQKTNQKSNENVAYVTIDDGPSDVTDRVLDILDQHQIKATFFINGHDSSDNRKRIRRMIDAGHAIGNHTWSHDYADYQDASVFLADVDRLTDYLQSNFGYTPHVFRFPGGSSNTKLGKHPDVKQAILEGLEARDLRYVDWNVTACDSQPSPMSTERIWDNIQRQLHEQNEIIFLMHDTSNKQTSAEALLMLIEQLKKQSYRFNAF